MRPVLKLAAPFLVLLGLAAATPDVAHAGAKPAQQALEDMNAGKKRQNVVQNRFFLKAKRFEIAPVGGYVPNNAFAKRYVGGALLAYHFSETLAAEGAFLYSPDFAEGDLKDLTHTLVSIAHEGSGKSGFQQPINKMVMGATFAARWAPVYGKINLIGERVLNFDLYGVAGLGLLTVNKSYAVFSDEVAEGQAPTVLQSGTTEAKVPLNLGLGFDFFLSSSVALKLDARTYLYIDNEASYNPDVQSEESRLYYPFVASVGVSVFFPKMRPRLYDF